MKTDNKDIVETPVNTNRDSTYGHEKPLPTPEVPQRVRKKRLTRRGSFPYAFKSKWLYISLAVYWIVTWLLPWSEIGRWGWVKDTVEFVVPLVPSIRGISDQLHFMPDFAMEALLAFLHMSGAIFCNMSSGLFEAGGIKKGSQTAAISADTGRIVRRNFGSS